MTIGFIKEFASATKAMGEEAVSSFTKKKIEKPSLIASGKEFFQELGAAWRFLNENRLINLFSALKLLVVWVLVFAAVQPFDWVNDTFYQALWDSDHPVHASDIEHSMEDTFFKLHGLWLAFVVIVGSYPLAILDACIISVAYLRRTMQPVTVMNCLRLAYANLAAIWALSIYKNVRHIISSKEEEEKEKSPAAKALKAILSFIISVVIMFGLPALVAKKSIIEYKDDFIKIFKTMPARVLMIRIGYGFLFKLIAAFSFVIAIVAGFALSPLSIDQIDLKLFSSKDDFLALAYSFILPFTIGVSLIVFFLKPLYLILITNIYADHAEIKQEKVTPSPIKFSVTRVVFAILLCVYLGITFFGDHVMSKTFNFLLGTAPSNTLTN